MKGRNCPNCGAPLDSAVCKCSYCGTSYFDISAIDADSGEPFYLKIRTRMRGKPAIVTALVCANPSITMSMCPGNGPSFSMEFEACRIVNESRPKFMVEFMEEEK